MDIKLELKEEGKTTTYTLDTRPTEKAVTRAVGSLAARMRVWVRDSFKKDTSQTLM